MEIHQIRKHPPFHLYLLGLVVIFQLGSCSKAIQDEYTVMKGAFRQSFVETGELAAVNSTAIGMPNINYQYGYEFKIAEMITNGSHVRRGDTLVVLEGSTIQRYIISQKEALENEQAASNKQEVECQNSIQDLEAQLRSEQASFDLKKLALERAKYETEQKRKVKELEFKQATIRLEKLKRHLKMKPQMNALDQRVQRIKILQKQAELEGAYDALKDLSIISPEEGLFQVGNSMMDYPPRDLQVGDIVFQGALIARIPDITYMRVNTQVNEADFTKIKLGSPVIVRLDALPSVPFEGEVTYIHKMCFQKEKEKVFKVQVDIKESDLRLKPGMTVSCEYICYEGNDDLFVPNSCLMKENGHAYLFIDRGSSPRKVEVEAGRSNSHHTMISGDVKPGQKLVPFEFILNPETL